MTNKTAVSITEANGRVWGVDGIKEIHLHHNVNTPDGFTFTDGLLCVTVLALAICCAFMMGLLTKLVVKVDSVESRLDEINEDDDGDGEAWKMMK